MFNKKRLITTLLSLWFCSYLLAQNPCGGGDPGDSTCHGGCGGEPPDTCDVCIPVVVPKDPNAIIGPRGYDTVLKWVSVKDNLPYKILFENDPDFATAPAQKVIIYLPIHPKLNPASLRIGDFGFGSFTFAVPPATAVYTKRLDVRDSLGVLLDVTAGLDVTNRRAFWIFESIDPATGLAATLPAGAGFLPVNDSTKGNGEGYVTFTVQPLSTAQTRDTVSATAAIIFDTNDPLLTNTEINTVDAVAPTSRMAPMPVVVDSVFTVSWSGRDDSLGVGVAYYDLYVSKNNGPFSLVQQKIDSTHFTFTGEAGATYQFYTLATDYTGNREAAKTTGDGTVTVKGAGLLVSAKVFLGGAYVFSAGTMTDSLRTQGILPAAEPYRALGFTSVRNTFSETARGGVFDSTGNAAITDWVWVELRNAGNPAQVTATRSGLLRRDGMIVDADGSSPLFFNGITEGAYHIAVRHRNHLGVMTATAIALNKTTATPVDFSNPATATWGIEAQQPISGVMALWPGDVNGNKQVKYNGASNDRNAVLASVGLALPNNVVSGYQRSDANLDGKVRYNGAANDKNVILATVGLPTPNNVRTEQLPN